MPWGVTSKKRPTVARDPRAADERSEKTFRGTTNVSKTASRLLIAATTFDPIPVRFFWPPYFGFGKLSLILGSFRGCERRAAFIPRGDGFGGG
jgi:hypothetical protein